jgi:hypothetical protein
VAGSSTVNRDTTDFYFGTASCRFDIDASNNSAAVYSGNISDIGAKVRVALWAKASSAGARINIKSVSTGVVFAAFTTLATSWTQYAVDVNAIGTTGLFIEGLGASCSIWMDDVTITPLGCVVEMDSRWNGVGLTVPDASGAGRNFTLPAKGVTPTIKGGANPTFEQVQVSSLAGSGAVTAGAASTWTGALALPANGLNVGAGQLQVTGGNVSASGNLTVSGGTITGGASGLSLAAGGTNQNITLTPSGSGSVITAIGSVTEHADNAAAVTAGLAVGTLYRTGDAVKIVHA